jgi:hypothetical protein
MISAPIIPKRRVSISVARKKRRDGLSKANAGPDLDSVTLAIHASLERASRAGRAL